MKKISFSIIIFVVINLFISCKKNNDVPVSPTDNYIQLAEGYASGAATKVAVFASVSAFTGYNQLYIALYDSITNNYVDNAKITLSPLMNMPGMSHAAPYENPTATRASDHLFPCSISFLMASTWDVTVNVTNLSSNKSGAATLNINVQDPSTAQQISFTSLIDNTTTYFVDFIPPAKPVVGLNDIEFVVYKKQSMMQFPADSSLTLTFEPEMPAMGHSSPNNVQPTHAGNGHYKGKVNFTMTGLWRLNMMFNSGSAVADSTHYFDFSF
ncbi:MAG: FixH family protein [Chitinophagaceae bacterium]|jgi:hypothetical protein|nr:FixH family protein [Chitinophagaceae bacterium]